MHTCKVKDPDVIKDLIDSLVPSENDQLVCYGIKVHEMVETLSWRSVCAGNRKDVGCLETGNLKDKEQKGKKQDHLQGLVKMRPEIAEKRVFQDLVDGVFELFAGGFRQVCVKRRDRPVYRFIP